MLVDVSQQAPRKLYVPYVHVHNFFSMLSSVGDLLGGLPVWEQEGQQVSEQPVLFIAEKIKAVTGPLQTAQPLIAQVLPWLAMGTTHRPLPRLSGPSCWNTRHRLVASSYHELAAEIAEGLMRDLAFLGDHHALLMAPDLQHLTDLKFVTDGLGELAQHGWKWPLMQRCAAESGALRGLLRQEFLRAWAQMPIRADELTGTNSEDRPVLDQLPENGCSQRDFYFFRLKSQNRKPAEIRNAWNSKPVGERKEIAPGCCGTVSIEVVRKQLKRMQKKAPSA
ncbi:hypothetical protein ETAA8_35590 [Anatilimnocola aggregata]|uniref:Uncharacterized protein n=1 Tax=Anatilimnocola aggregata TaxID=2528021 RepID=A0A517YE08_9BACT|nr:hypothetical protein [Anatilimnocola aggregata]QDU28459.1 hypothetical protein ETAA8_35590 [Anatilimnocola aggregata]